MRHNANNPERFWQKVDRYSQADCWPFKGYIGKNGYGYISYKLKKRTAHRLAWELTHGDPGELCVLHRCDNRRCCNPDHLFLGTVLDNQRDMVAKGRQARGEHQGGSKLTTLDVQLIRWSHKLGVASQAQIARVWGVTQSNISHVVRDIAGRTWRHV